MNQRANGPRGSSQPEPRRLTQGFEVIDWIEACCVFTEGVWRGKPFRLLPWQKRLLLELFTLEEDPEWMPPPAWDGQRAFRAGLRRRYREAFITVPKKNGKGDLAAAIALYLLIGDGEPSPKGVFAAGSLKQAGLSFRACQTMILESPILSQLVGPRNVGDLVIEVPSIPGSRMERVAAEAGTNDGPSLHFGVLDEVHEYEGEQGVKVHGVITNAGAARANSLFVSISTVGSDADDVDQVWAQLYARGRAAQADPGSDPTFYFYCVQAPSGTDWQDRAVWEAANPSANVTVSWAFYTSQWHKGERWCRRYYLNDPPGGSDEAWLTPEAWAATAGVVRFLSCEPTYVAVMFAPGHRTAAIAAAQRHGGPDGRPLVHVRIFPDDEPDDDPLEIAPLEEHVRELHREHRAPVFARRRLVPGGPEVNLPTPGPEVMYHGAYFEGSAQRLRDEGIAARYEPASQAKLDEAADALRSHVEVDAEKRLAQDGGAELARQMGNVLEHLTPTGRRLVAKPGKRIEAARAAMVAVHRAMKAERPPAAAPPIFGSFS